MKMMSGNINYTIDELAERLDMSYRTIYRYIDTIRSRIAAYLVLSRISIYTNSANRKITTLALALRLVSADITTTTGNNINIHNGSTMSGGSR